MRSNTILGRLLAASVLAASAASQAAPVDVTTAAADIAGQAAPVGVIGVACLLVYGAVKAFGWVRGALK